MTRRVYVDLDEEQAAEFKSVVRCTRAVLGYKAPVALLLMRGLKCYYHEAIAETIHAGAKRRGRGRKAEEVVG